ncbi:hypothetical protein B0H12DRAFT_1135985 [Mycena haematopus]|nr:hypothetical protein B0H12DRAFT_1135985 [Mycena haematopus]
MVKSRWKSPDCALSRATLLTDSPSDLDSLEDLKLLRQEGLDFCSISQGDSKTLHATTIASWVYN